MERKTNSAGKVIILFFAFMLAVSLFSGHADAASGKKTSGVSSSRTAHKGQKNRNGKDQSDSKRRAEACISLGKGKGREEGSGETGTAGRQHAGDRKTGKRHTG